MTLLASGRRRACEQGCGQHEMSAAPAGQRTVGAWDGERQVLTQAPPAGGRDPPAAGTSADRSVGTTRRSKTRLPSLLPGARASPPAASLRRPAGRICGMPSAGAEASPCGPPERASPCPKHSGPVCQRLRPWPKLVRSSPSTGACPTPHSCASWGSPSSPATSRRAEEAVASSQSTASPRLTPSADSGLTDSERLAPRTGIPRSGDAARKTRSALSPVVSGRLRQAQENTERNVPPD